MNFVDTHCHLYLEGFQDDLEEVLGRAAAANVRDIFLPAIDWHSLQQMDTLTRAASQLHEASQQPDESRQPVETLPYTESQLNAESHAQSPIRFWKMAGVHPCDVTGRREGLRDTLHYYWSKDHVAAQQESLAIHLEVAKETGKPVVLHNRDSTDDLLGIVREHQDGRLTGVWHCFNGTVEQGREAIELGLHLGIGGVVTFKNGGVAEVVEQLPLERMILETDAPYLTPTPHRGTRNEPSYIPLIAQKLADVMRLGLDEIASVTTRNAYALFGIDERVS
ncbi:MAG: hypothetical protein DA443_05715, partial [Bacteroidetes bacterium]